MSGIGLPKSMTKDDAYVQGIADTEDKVRKAAKELQKEPIPEQVDRVQSAYVDGYNDALDDLLAYLPE